MNRTAHPRSTTSDLSRSYSDAKHRLTKLQPSGVAIELASIPSEISDDEWAEITKYQQDKDNEKKRLEIEEQKVKKRNVKAILDQQFQLRQEEKLRKIKEKKEYEEQLLRKCQEDLEEEKRKQ